jgi:transposase
MSTKPQFVFISFRRKSNAKAQPGECAKLRAQGKTIREIADSVPCSVSAVSNALRKFREANEGQ